MISRQRMIRTVVLFGCAAFLAALSLELLRRSKPNFLSDETEMLYPEVLSGVWVTGFEESSFFPGNTAIPDRNDSRRYKVDLIANQKQFDELRKIYPGPAYAAFHVTFIGRRTKYPVGIDCEGSRYYYFIPDWILRARYLGLVANPDRPVRKPGPYRPFKRSGERGAIRKLEDEALASCGPHNR